MSAAEFLYIVPAALQIWALAEIIKMRDKVIRIETQIGRIVSDIESEKETMKRRHTHFDSEIKQLWERVNHMEARHAEHQ